MQPSSKSDLRKFGLTVGGMLLLIAGISWWRGHEIPPRVLASCGTALVVPALLVPTLLGPVQRGWMAFAHVLGNVNTRIILTTLFYVVLTPIAFVIRFFRDPLNRALDTEMESDWIPHSQEPSSLETYKRQF